MLSKSALKWCLHSAFNSFSCVSIFILDFYYLLCYDSVMYCSRANFGTEAITNSSTAYKLCKRPRARLSHRELLSNNPLHLISPFYRSGNKKPADPESCSPDKLCVGPARGGNIGLLCELFGLSGIRLLLNFLFILSTNTIVMSTTKFTFISDNYIIYYQ